MSITAKSTLEEHVGTRNATAPDERRQASTPHYHESLKILPAPLGRRERDLLKNMRRRRLRCRKRQLEVVDDPIHGLLVRDEGDNLHRPPALGALRFIMRHLTYLLAEKR